MRQHSLVASSILLLALTLALAVVAVAADSNVGTWKLNLSQTKSGGPAPQSVTIKIEGQDNGVKFARDTVDAEGKTAHLEFSAKYDGKDYPMAGNTTIALTRIDANSVDAVIKNGGKEMMRERWVVSADGKTRTVTQEGKNAKGEAVTTIRVFDRQ